MHLPSGVKEWHIPPTEAFPSPPALFTRLEPEEEQDTSYLALSVKISSFFASNIPIALPQTRIAAKTNKCLCLNYIGFRAVCQLLFAID